MNTKSEATLDVAAAMLVLFTAMVDARVSAGLAIIFLLGLTVYKLTRKS